MFRKPFEPDSVHNQTFPLMIYWIHVSMDPAVDYYYTTALNVKLFYK